MRLARLRPRSIQQAMFLPEEGGRNVQVTVSPEMGGECNYETTEKQQVDHTRVRRRSGLCSVRSGLQQVHDREFQPSSRDSTRGRNVPVSIDPRKRAMSSW